MENKQLSNRKANRFFGDLEKILKRHHPKDFVPLAIRVIHNVLNDPNKQVYYPIHHVIHSIEASCAYSRSYNDQVTEERFNRVINLYKKYYDPYLQYTLDIQKDIILAFLAIAHQQLALQRYPNIHEWARAIYLFNDNDLPKSSELLKDTYELTFEEWIFLCFGVLTATGVNTNIAFDLDYFLRTEIKNFPKHAVIPFLELSSTTFSRIRENYFEIRNRYEPFLNIFHTSLFFSYPIIVSKSQYMLVHPYMIIYHATEGLYRTCSELDEEKFGEEFGHSFEKYVGDLIESFPNKLLTLNEPRIIQEVSGKSTDYIILFDDSIVLIECKATRYSADLLTENAIAKNNSTGKIAEAYIQIDNTAQQIRRGALGNLVEDLNKPIYGIVITFGNLPFVNSDYYFEKFIKSRMYSKVVDFASWPFPLSFPPQTFSIDTFESLITTVVNTDYSVRQIFEMKMEEEYLKVGDWPEYIANIEGANDDWIIPLLDDAGKNLFNKYGIVDF